MIDQRNVQAQMKCCRTLHHILDGQLNNTEIEYAINNWAAQTHALAATIKSFCHPGTFQQRQSKILPSECTQSIELVF